MWSRWQRVNRGRIGALFVVRVLALMALVVGVVGAVFPTDVWRVKLSREGVKLAFLRPTDDGDGFPIIFEDDFSDRRGKWSAKDTPAALVEYSGGGLRIVVHGDDTLGGDFEVRPLARDVAAVRVEAEATLLSRGKGIIVGLACAASTGSDAPTTGGAGAYALLIDPATRHSGIGRVRTPLEDGLEASEWLHQGTVPGEPFGRRIRLAAECANAGNGDRRVSFWVNGRRAGSASHARGSAAFDGVGFVVFVSGPGRTADVRFDNIVVRKLDP